MNLVREVNNAAIWNIKLLNIDSHIVDAESGIPPGMLVMHYFFSDLVLLSHYIGTVIQFELVDANISTDTLGSTTSPSSSLLLAFETVAGGGTSKPVIVEQQQHQQDGKQNLLLLPSQQPQPQKQDSYSQNYTDGEGFLCFIVSCHSCCDHE